MALSPIVLEILIVVGQIVLTLFYGTLGTIFTAIQFVRLGPNRFFRKVQRSTPPSVATDPVYGQHGMLKLKSSDVSLHYVSNGSSDKPLMLFIHGFPECWYTWRHQMKHFSKDYRVVAIDQRGFGLSSKPPKVADYKVENLVRDVVDVIEQLGYTSCVLVGHDWGAIVSWTVAMHHPNLIDKLIIMNVPHPSAYIDSISLAQIRKSWYIFFFQVPFIPELIFQADDYAYLNHCFLKEPIGLVNKNKMTSDELEVFKYSFAQEGAPHSAINYYRALVRYRSDYLFVKVNVPVLMIWGCQDGALGEELADASQKYCFDIQLKKIEQASHWVQQDVPDEVNRYMEVFLQEKAKMK